MKIEDIIDFLEKEKKINFEYMGDKFAQIDCVASLNAIRENAICWIKSEKFLTDGLVEKIKEANAVIVTPFLIEDINCILTDYPKRTYFTILRKFFSNHFEHTISESATILTKRVGNNVHIGANCYIAQDVFIGDNTIIYPNVNILCPCKIGKDCIIFSGSTIGADGFGYHFDDEGLPVKVTHLGGVTIGNRVEIGANTCIDRGTIDNTIIHDDVKIDNLVHIAHNTIIQKGSIIIAGALICGSAVIEERGYIAPGAIIKNQVTIGNDSLVGLGAVVVKDVENHIVVAGLPAKKIRTIKSKDK